MQTFREFITEGTNAGAYIRRSKEIRNPSTPVIDKDEAESWRKTLESQIKASFVKVSASDLGGEDVMIRLSLDKEKDWNHGIFQNSRYAQIRISRLGRMEMFSLGLDLTKKYGNGPGNMRKTVVKSSKEAVTKINKWIAKAS
jgi:hypothetical protein